MGRFCNRLQTSSRHLATRLDRYSPDVGGCRQYTFAETQLSIRHRAAASPFRVNLNSPTSSVSGSWTRSPVLIRRRVIFCRRISRRVFSI